MTEQTTTAPRTGNDSLQVAETVTDPGAGASGGQLDPEVERVWQEHWWPIVSTNGNLDLDQIKRELFDYGTLLDNVSWVYCHVTGGVASKPFTLPSVINALHDDFVSEQIDEAVEEERQIAIDEGQGMVAIPETDWDVIRVALMDVLADWDDDLTHIVYEPDRASKQYAISRLEQAIAASARPDGAR